MKTKQEAIQEQIDEIMDTFDFERVHKWMKHDQWTWLLEGVPDVRALRMAARQRLKEAATHGASSMGGFTATKCEGSEGGRTWVRMDLSFGIGTLNDGTEYDQ